MKVYKGTDKDIKCRGYQFTPGVEAVEDRAELCSKGFHACEAPLDVLGYYPPGDGSRYFEAELEDVSPERHSEDTKVCGKRITLGAEIGIPGLVKASIEYTKSKCEKENSATGGWSANSATGYGSANVSTGEGCENSGGVASVNVGWGVNNKCKGEIGSYIVLSEWGAWDGNEYPLIGAKMGLIDGETLKPDTWYKLENGEFVEVEA